MPRYEITTTVNYTFEVEADSLEEAEELGYDYEEYKYFGEVADIEVAELEEREDEEDE
jgi:hypothetical protein